MEAARVAGYAVRAAGAYRLHSGPAVRVTIANLDHDQIDELAAAIALSVSGRDHSPMM